VIQTLRQSTLSCPTAEVAAYIQPARDDGFTLVKTLAAYPLAFSISTQCSELYSEITALTSALPSVLPDASVDLHYTIERTSRGYSIRCGGLLLATAVPRCAVFLGIQENLSYQLKGCSGVSILHAAAVVKDGHALLLVGKRRSGKSSLTALLLQEGFQLLSDEFAPISRDGTVRGHRFPLRLRSSALNSLRLVSPAITVWPDSFPNENEEVFYGLPNCDVLAPDQDWPIRLILFPLFENSTGAAIIANPDDALHRLLQQTHNRQAAREVADIVAIRLTRKVPCYCLRMGELQAALRLVSRLWDSDIAGKPFPNRGAFRRTMPVLTPPLSISIVNERADRF